MSKAGIKLTVYFEDPFWVGVFEKVETGKLSASKVTFGAEPKDYEVNEFVKRRFFGVPFSPAVAAEVKTERKNPKRLIREAKRQTADRGIGTKSQQALKLQQEEHKLERKRVSREEREAEKERQFELKQEKKKEKHRGH